MKKKSKKGITLVELIIACAVMALVFAAAAGALKLSLDNYKSSNIISNNLQSATILEEYIKGAFSSAENITLSKNLSPAVPVTDKKYIYFTFDTNNNVVVTKRDSDGTETKTASLKGIESIHITIKESGTGNSKRLVASYKITLPIDVGQNTVVNGSIILKNSAKTTVPALADEMICAYHPDPSPDAPIPTPHPIKYLIATIPD